MKNIPIPNKHIVLREEFDDWALLFDADKSKIIGINPTAVEIWKLINGKRSIEEIVFEIRQNFTNVPTELVEDISDFLEQLYKNDLIAYEMENKCR